MIVCYLDLPEKPSLSKLSKSTNISEINIQYLICI